MELPVRYDIKMLVTNTLAYSAPMPKKSYDCCPNYNWVAWILERLLASHYQRDFDVDAARFKRSTKKLIQTLFQLFNFAGPMPLNFIDR